MEGTGMFQIQGRDPEMNQEFRNGHNALRKRLRKRWGWKQSMQMKLYSFYFK